MSIGAIAHYSGLTWDRIDKAIRRGNFRVFRCEDGRRRAHKLDVDAWLKRRAEGIAKDTAREAAKLAEAAKTYRFQGRWFRFYANAIDNEKLFALPDRLFKAWAFLLCIASETNDAGALPSTKTIARRLNFSEKEDERNYKFSD